jgi:molecular chaperone DnaK (HSP70)
MEHIHKAVAAHLEKMDFKNVKCNEMASGIPANFGDRQRNRTMEAASLANLKCHRLINEPTAVAYAHIIQNPENKSKYRLILDLGGGTFDVTFVHYDHDRCQMVVLNKSGDNNLGGEDLTMAVADLIAKKLGRDGVNLSVDDRHKVLTAAEKTKRAFDDEKLQSHE